MNDLFLERMREMLKDEYPAYLEKLNDPARKGLRINTLKITPDDFFACTNYELEKSPFAKNGYYANIKSGVGFTPEHMAGFFYIQEPSASSAVTILDPKPGMKVLDMCAAPGSKSTQISEMLEQEGLLVANEIHPTRSRILLENIERCGSANTIVLNNDPKDISKAFPEFFDMVLCDAPCSGEGMFRKEDQAVEQWSLENVQACALRQSYILEEAYKCLKPGGTMVYSTCTFASLYKNILICTWFQLKLTLVEKHLILDVILITQEEFFQWMVVKDILSRNFKKMLHQQNLLLNSCNHKHCQKKPKNSLTNFL